MRLAAVSGERAFQLDTKVVTAFDLWFPKDSRQRVLWPQSVRLSEEYWGSLQRYAVPLDERAVAALAHSALGLDLYAWLAQRLHRVTPGKPAFVPWPLLKEQFGWRYGRLDKFKAVFRGTLEMVLTQYRRPRLIRLPPPPRPWGQRTYPRVLWWSGHGYFGGASGVLARVLWWTNR